MRRSICFLTYPAFFIFGRNGFSTEDLATCIVMQSLLSPAESHAFQSFLSTMDYTDDTLTASEWALYNSHTTDFNMQDDAQLDGDVNPERREALTKATKDLMSLDPEGWSGSASMANHNSNAQNHNTYEANGNYDLHQTEQRYLQQQRALDEQRQRQLQHLQHQQDRQHHNSFSSGSDIFPFLHSKMHQDPPTQELRYPMQRPQQHSHLALSPLNTSSSDHGSPTTPSHPHSFSGFQQQPSTQLQNQPHQVHIPQHPHPDHSRGGSPASGPSIRAKRPPVQSSMLGSLSTSSSLPHSSIANSDQNVSSSSGTRSNPPTSNGPAKRMRSSTSPVVSLKTNGAVNSQSRSQTGLSKPSQTLLSPSQKKANHIQSEQKRRANIRRGYEALCETVPALREAIREEEEAERNAANGVKGRKKSRSRKGQKDGDQKEKDKLDGRAGPRSENVVLSKTIEHIQELIADRSALLARLHRARSCLPPGHHALTPLIADPPWEREWKGGSGRLGDEDPEGEGESEGEDEGGDGE